MVHQSKAECILGMQLPSVLGRWGYNQDAYLPQLAA